jgi:hypothetical protein
MTIERDARRLLEADGPIIGSRQQVAVTMIERVEGAA